MHTHCINIFNRTDHDTVVATITNNFHLVFLPSNDRLFDQKLIRGGSIQASLTDNSEFVFIVGYATPAATEGKARSDDRREPGLLQSRKCFNHRVRKLSGNSVEANSCHRIAESLPVFSLVDCLTVGPNHLDTVPVQNTLSSQVKRTVQPGLPTHCRQQGIGALLLNYRRDRLPINWLDIGRVGKFGIRHDRSRV